LIRNGGGPAIRGDFAGFLEEMSLFWMMLGTDFGDLSLYSLSAGGGSLGP
jgi:hypothetical protein